MKGSLMGASPDNGSAGSIRSRQDTGGESALQSVALRGMGNGQIMEKPFIIITTVKR